MGNEVSSSEVEEEPKGPVEESNPEFAVEVKNGPVTLQSSPLVSAAPGGNHVSTKEVVQQENGIASSQKTIVFSPISNGSVTNPPPPAAKSKFRLTISRPSSGLGDVKPEITFQESPVVQTQLMTPINPDGAVVTENAGSVQSPVPPSVLAAEEVSLSSTNPTEEEPASTKPREVSVFHKLFKPEKKTPSTEQPEGTINQPMVITVDQNATLQSCPPSDDLQTQSEDEQNTQNTPPAEHPVMSFFKTLVTPNKSVPKSEEELKTEGEDKKNGGLRKSSSKKEKHKSAGHQPSQTEAETLRKSDSPKSGTLSRLFKQKSKKDEQQTSGGKDELEQPVVSVSITSEKSPPEQILIQDPPDVPTQITASQEEGKAAKESAAPRPKLFWRKSFKAEPPASKMQENGAEGPAAQSVSVTSTPEQMISVQETKPADSEVQPQESEGPAAEQPSRSVPFWRKSFKGDPPRQYQDNVVVEQPVVSVTPEPSPSEDVLTLDTKPFDTQQPQREAAARPLPFWRKSFKADPPPQKAADNVVVEQPLVSVTVNSEKSPPALVLPPDTKAVDSDTQPPESEAPQNEVAARPLPFWRKPSAEEPPAVQLTLTSSEPEAQSSTSNPADKGAAPGGKSPQNKKPEDGKSAKPKIMMFFKQLSVMGDGSNISPEETNEKSVPEPTLDITDGVEVSKNEKTVVTAVVEPPPPPPPQKGKDSAKEKKASAEKLNKQESRESAEAIASAQLQAPDPVQVDNGMGASREGQLKRTEKRQSLGSFFKAIGPKRMYDAEVQTDPVTVLPAEKSK
ncbi:breast carcinoma-amplified sequence 1 isoform X3 [Eleutherodactylus coqui]|uniref:breast carcinoma-amplified sequence 1 isoform X3 n=1 Tax=Eleutherodactylus coqui TaxID=57060 RepID=UPI0034631448